MIKKFVMLLLIGLSSFSSLHAQDATNYTANFQETTLKEALQFFEKEYGYYFSYNDDLVTDKMLSVQINTPLIEKALTQLLAGTSIDFEILDSQFIALKELTFNEWRLQGHITDEEGLPLPYAAIVSSRKNAYVVSDEEGYFTIPVLEGDTLMCKYLGFNSQYIIINDQEDLGNGMEVRLKQVSHQLIDLLIEEQLNQVSDLANHQVSAYEIVGTGINSSANAQLDNSFYAIKLLPGVSSSGYSSSLSVRGGSSDQNMTLIDGNTMYQLDHYYGLQNVINPELIQSATMMKGGFESMYGGRVSGILDVQLKDPPLNYVEGSAGVSFLDAEAYLSVPIVKNKLSTYVAYRRFHGFINEYLYGRIDQSPKVVTDENGQEVNVYKRTINPDIKYHDFNGKLLWKVNKDHTFSTSVIASKDSYFSKYSLLDGVEIGPRFQRLLDLLGNPSLENTQDKAWTNSGINAEWLVEKEQWTSSTTFNLSQYKKSFHQVEHVRDTTKILPQPIDLFEEEKLQEYSFNTDHIIEDGQSAYLFGVNLKKYYLERYSFPTTKFEESLNGLNDANLVGVYGQYNYLSPSQIELKLGSRVWIYGATQKAYFSPRLSMNYKGVENWTFKMAMGRYFQFLHQLSDAFTYDAYWILSNGQQVSVLSSDHYIAGLTHKNGAHKFDSELYFKNTQGDISDLSYRNPLFVTALQGSGHSYGIDSFYEWQNDRFYQYIAYAYNYNIKQYGPTLQELKRTHTIQWAGMYKRKHFKMGFAWELRSVGYEFVGWDGFNEYPLLRYYLLEPFEAPLYHRLDFSVQYDFKLSQKTKGLLAMTIYDLYNQQNVTERIIEEGPNLTETQQLEYMLTDVSQLGILPNISFKVIF